MIYVFNKEKIIAYIISVVTAVSLFGIFSIGNVTHDSVQTSVDTRLLPIYSVKTEEEKVAFTINCAW